MSQAVVSYVGTIGTIESGINIGTIEVGTIEAIVDLGTIGVVATIGTIVADVHVSAVATIGTIENFGTISEERVSSRVSIWLNGSVVGVFSSTLDMSSWDSVTVDVISGTITTGSLLVSVVGVEPLLGELTSTIVASDWLVNGMAQRLAAPNALGESLAVVGSVTGTVVGLTITAVRKT